MRLSDRIAHLEHAVNHAPMLILEIDRYPTPDQAAETDAAARSGHRLLVYVKYSDTSGYPLPVLRLGVPHERRHIEAPSI